MADSGMSPRGVRPIPTDIPSTRGVTLFNSLGTMPQAKVWTGTATVDAAGNFTVNYSSAGFTSNPNVTATPKTISPQAVIITSLIPSTGSCTGTAVSLTTTLGVVSVGLSGINGSILNIQAIGT